MCWPLTGRCSFERPLTPESDIPPPRLRLGVSPSTRSFLPRHLTRESLNRPISSSEQSNQPFGLRVHRAAVIRDWEETFDLTPLPPIFFSPEIPQDPGISLVTMGSRQPEIVDLTSNPTRQTPINLSSSPLASGFASSSRNGEHAPRGIKRPRTDEPCSSSASSDVWPGRQAIETIDMTEDSHAAELAKAVAKQREDAIKAQQSGAEKDRTKTALMAYTCPICMDTPVDATATSCGHLFCHKCIMDYLTIIEETRGDSSKQNKGTCPVCRKPLSSKEQPGKSRSLIPLQFKLHTKTRSEFEADRKAREYREAHEADRE